jgi:hypothetical protein
LDDPGANNVIICGCARTGTSLLSAALYRPPEIVTVMEPWDGMRFPPAELFASLRREIATGHLARGRLDLRALDERGAVKWAQDGSVESAIEVADAYTLAVKWPVYWRYLDLLPNARFIVCLRNPVEVINSFVQAGGRLALGLHYNTAFNAQMNRHLQAATDDTALRRVLLFDYIHERIIPHLERDNVLIVRYERWFEDPASLMDEIGSFLRIRLQPPRVAIVPPEPVRLDEMQLRLIREHCATAERLGYRIGDLAPDATGGGRAQ